VEYEISAVSICMFERCWALCKASARCRVLEDTLKGRVFYGLFSVVTRVGGKDRSSVWHASPCAIIKFIHEGMPVGLHLASSCVESLSSRVSPETEFRDRKKRSGRRALSVSLLRSWDDVSMADLMVRNSSGPELYQSPNRH
jgi:hypothetical protein